jgi:hypothetical protein
MVSASKKTVFPEVSRAASKRGRAAAGKAGHELVRVEACAKQPLGGSHAIPSQALGMEVKTDAGAVPHGCHGSVQEIRVERLPL